MEAEKIDLLGWLQKQVYTQIIQQTIWEFEGYNKTIQHYKHKKHPLSLMKEIACWHIFQMKCKWLCFMIVLLTRNK